MLSDLPANGQKATDAWQLIIGQCDMGTTDLEVQDLRQEFQDLSLEAHVGYDDETITRAARQLNSINTKIPKAKKYDENALCIKLLCMINHPGSLALEAVKELRAPEGSRRFEHAVEGRLRLACVTLEP